MGWKEAAGPVLSRMPGVRRPDGHVPFRRKLAWTAGVLLLYFFLTNITLFGLAGEAASVYGETFQALLAAQRGTVMQLGIGPIVTASIVLQLLNGADLLGLDTSEPRDQMIYQGLQKVLVLVMIGLTGLPMVFLGGFLPPGNVFGLPTVGVQVLMFLQIAIGGVLVLYMDEVVSKWGVGSGIGLFIVAGISQSLFAGLFYWGGGQGQMGFVPTWIAVLTGSLQNVPPLLSSAGIQYILFDQTAGIVALFTTALIFVIVVYAESVRVEIPLSHAQVKGARGRFPVKLIYASVLPMILVRALQANIQFAGRILNSWTGIPAWVGTYQQGQPTGGLMYFLAPIQAPTQWMWWVSGPAATHAVWEVLLRVALDLSFMIVGGAIFAVFWVETADMGPDATAQQIKNSGMQIPGFRKNVGVIEKVMERYIPQVTVLGGALVGLLAVMANMMGTIGNVSGTGLLLAISITYKLYEEIAEEQLMEMHPMMR
ncbi:MAG: preprotein translocase subunit SecY, partial [Halobacteriaceae archaeon]